jgi:hypothetical protein
MTRVCWIGSLSSSGAVRSTVPWVLRPLNIFAIMRDCFVFFLFGGVASSVGPFDTCVACLLLLVDLSFLAFAWLRVLAWRMLMFQLVELVKQSKRRNCEDMCVQQWCALEKGGACGSPVFFSSYGQVPRWSVLSRVMSSWRYGYSSYPCGIV